MSDVGDLLELLHGAGDRRRTVHATVRSWHHCSRGPRAFERHVAASSSTMSARCAGEGEPPETSERREEIRIAKPGPGRQEGEWHVTVARKPLADPAGRLERL